MKKLSVLLFLFCAFLSLSAQSDSHINWLSFEELNAKMEKAPKPMLFDIYTVWCGPCTRMKKEVFTNKKLVDYINENYYAVAINAESRKEIKFNGKTFEWKPEGRNGFHDVGNYVSDNKCIGYPTISIMDTEYNVKYAKSKYHNADEMRYLLERYNK